VGITLARPCPLPASRPGRCKVNIYAGTPESGNADFFVYKTVLYMLTKSSGVCVAVHKSYTVYAANSLEDTLGIVAALVTARVNTSGQYVSADWINAQHNNMSGSAVVAATRLGSGRTEAIIFVVPPLLSFIFLARLTLMKLDLGFTSRKRERESIAPKYSSSMRELMGLGHTVDLVE
jgi:hypothetical protein